MSSLDALSNDGPSTRSLRVRTENASRRERFDRLMRGVLLGALVLALIPLALILFEVLRQGLGAVNWEFLSHTQPFSQRKPGGGYLNGLVGTLYMVAIATVVSLPMGIAAAVFVVEFPESRLRPFIQFFTDVMTGVPSIFVGLFIYSVLVQGRLGFGTLVGGLALSLLMLPIVVRSAEEILRLVPNDLRNAAYGLGARRWQVVTRVVLPAAGPGLATGSMLAVARAAGETAPLLLTALGSFEIVTSLVGRPQSALPLLIYGEARSAYDAAHARAWAGALELMAFVLLFTLLARVISSRTTARR